MDRELVILRLSCILGCDYDRAKDIVSRVERQTPQAWWLIERSRKTRLTTRYAVTDNQVQPARYGWLFE